MACYFHMTSHYGSAQTSQKYIIRLQEFPTLKKKLQLPIILIIWSVTRYLKKKNISCPLDPEFDQKY